MGLSCKQVSSDGVDWSQTLLQAQTLQELPKPPASRRQQQQPEPLKCPRCESTNTKFCYYNNYNKSQPRHFCKTCKRHWTKGGTLRNVPVGGGRKNKRHKTSKANSNTITTATSTSAAAAANTIPGVATAACTNINSKIINRINPNMAFQGHHQQQNLLVPGDHQKNISDILYQAIVPPSSVLQQSSSVINSGNKTFSSNNNIVMFSDSRTPFTVPQNQDLQFPYTSSSSFDTNPPAFESSNAYYNNAEEVMESSTITTIMPTSCSTIATQPWQVPSTSSAMDMGSYWNWDDIDTFVPTDLNIPWDDPEIKP